MSSFNPEQFLDQQFDGTNDTKTIPVPVGEYTAVIHEVKCRTWTSSKDPSMAGLTLDVAWELDSPELKELLGRDVIRVKQGIMLDLTDNGGLDMGKGRNIGLGRLREAVDMNTPGQPFAFSMLPGRIAVVKVSHRIVGEDVFPDIKAVAHI